MKMKLAELISAATEKDWKLEVVDFGEPGEVFRSLSQGYSYDKRRRDYLVSSAVPFKIVLQKSLTVDFEKKSQVLACLVSQEQAAAFFLAPLRLLARGYCGR